LDFELVRHLGFLVRLPGRLVREHSFSQTVEIIGAPRPVP